MKNRFFLLLQNTKYKEVYYEKSSGVVDFVHVVNVTYAFANCIGLTHVHLGKSVETIGENVFLNSDSLTSITVDEETPYFMVEEGVLYS